MTYPLLISLTFFCSLAYAQTYQWIDQHGKIHFSDQPREGAILIDTQVQSHSVSKKGSNTENINQRIKSTSDRLAETRNKEVRARQNRQLSVARKNQNDRKKCEYFKDKIADNEYRWKLVRTQGYKQTQKDAYLIRNDKYKRGVSRHCR